MHKTPNIISQKTARESLGTPVLFRGVVCVTKNGSPSLFIMTASERAEELALLELERAQFARLIEAELALA